MTGSPGIRAAGVRPARKGAAALRPRTGSGEPTTTGRCYHPPLTELADAAEGLLGPDQSADAGGAPRGLFADCARRRRRCCGAVSRRLAAAPAPTMPAEVAARLDACWPARSIGGTPAVADVAPARALTTSRATWDGRGRPWATSAPTCPAVAAGGAAAGAGRGGGGGHGRVRGVRGRRERRPERAPGGRRREQHEPGAAGRGAAAGSRHGSAPVLPGLAVRPAGDQRPDRGLANSRVDGSPALLVFIRSGRDHPGRRGDRLRQRSAERGTVGPGLAPATASSLRAGCRRSDRRFAVWRWQTWRVRHVTEYESPPRPFARR